MYNENPNFVTLDNGEVIYIGKVPPHLRKEFVEKKNKEIAESEKDGENNNA